MAVKENGLMVVDTIETGLITVAVQEAVTETELLVSERLAVKMNSIKLRYAYQ